MSRADGGGSRQTCFVHFWPLGLWTKAEGGDLGGPMAVCRPLNPPLFSLSFIRHIPPATSVNFRLFAGNSGPVHVDGKQENK